MREIRQGKTYWQINDVTLSHCVAAAQTSNRGLSMFVSSLTHLTASEWSSLCSWVEEKMEEGRLWKEVKNG